MMTLPLDATQVHLWLIFPEDIRDEALLQRYLALLSSTERMQAPRFHFARDRHRYLVTRASIRTVLSRYTGLEPAEWQFTASSHGRPQIANGHADAASLSFNIAHTAGLIVIGVTRHCDLGVDVENMHDRPAPIDIADSYFAPDERSALLALPESRRGESFFRYWTLKESYIKARGLGLSIPLDQFSFHLPPDLRPREPLRFHTSPRLGDTASHWRFWQLCVAHDFVVAVCVGGIPVRPQVLLIRKLVPLIEERDHECEWMTASN